MAMPEAALSILREECLSVEPNLLYFNSAAHGLLPRCARKAVEQYLVDLQNGASEHDFAGAIERLRVELATWVGCFPDSVVFCSNVSAGLNLVLNGFAWEPGAEVLICPEIEHPTLVWAAHALSLRGVEVRTINARRAEVHTQDILGALTDKTQMVALSHVSFLSGGTVDLQKVGVVCRERRIFLLVDAAQSVGFTPINMENMLIDGLVANMHKGLLGLAGLGFLALNPQWLPRIRPLVVGQESVKGQYDRWQWAETARRFEVGHRNSVAAIAVLASLTLLRQVSIEIVAEHIYNLRAYLVDQLRALGFLVVAPDAHSHIVSIQPANVRAADMVQKLSQRSVKSAARGPFVRFSLHGYNTYDDVDRLTKILLSDAMR